MEKVGGKESRGLIPVSAGVKADKRLLGEVHCGGVVADHALEKSGDASSPPVHESGQGQIFALGETLHQVRILFGSVIHGERGGSVPLQCAGGLRGEFHDMGQHRFEVSLGFFRWETGCGLVDMFQQGGLALHLNAGVLLQGGSEFRRHLRSLPQKLANFLVGHHDPVAKRFAGWPVGKMKPGDFGKLFVVQIELLPEPP